MFLSGIQIFENRMAINQGCKGGCSSVSQYSFVESYLLFVVLRYRGGVTPRKCSSLVVCIDTWTLFDRKHHINILYWWFNIRSKNQQARPFQLQNIVAKSLLANKRASAFPLTNLICLLVLIGGCNYAPLYYRKWCFYAKKIILFPFIASLKQLGETIFFFTQQLWKKISWYFSKNVWSLSIGRYHKSQTVLRFRVL